MRQRIEHGRPVHLRLLALGDVPTAADHPQWLVINATTRRAKGDDPTPRAIDAPYPRFGFERRSRLESRAKGRHEGVDVVGMQQRPPIERARLLFRQPEK